MSCSNHDNDRKRTCSLDDIIDSLDDLSARELCKLKDCIDRILNCHS